MQSFTDNQQVAPRALTGASDHPHEAPKQFKEATKQEIFATDVRGWTQMQPRPTDCSRRNNRPFARVASNHTQYLPLTTCCGSR
jgi:hypothetical protein